ncbi:hypothetical protein MO867_20505 [Microbulbifer sp. OS29]|uniref:Uncharacterized protein n=1 Tax=Microbulbifer okhotskensis TaxID=2926617 RepID=A0A9X2EQT7_9GAMM|nr:hypothetical protein [Microbulbifer okhotskensis]MCO1336712.1 hypothetical protein [Microbulbifer okhotskensis]
MLGTSSTAPTEDALSNYENHQDSLPDETAADVERVEAGITEFLLESIFSGNQIRPLSEARYRRRFLEIAIDEIDQFKLKDILQCAASNKDFARSCALKLAREYHEELEPRAAEDGHIEGHPLSRRKPTQDEIENTVFFIEMHLFRETGALSNESALARELLDKHIGKFLEKYAEDCDSTGNGKIAEIAIGGDHAEAGYQYHSVAMETVRFIAEKYFWRFAHAARDAGCLELPGHEIVQNY